MKKTPRKKSKIKSLSGYEVIELPSNNQDMEKYVLDHRMEINNKLVNTIEYAVKNKLGGVEVFCFKNSNFVVVLHSKDYKESLQNIYNFSVEKEKFEICVRIKKILERINKLGFILNYKKTKK